MCVLVMFILCSGIIGPVVVISTSPLSPLLRPLFPRRRLPGTNGREPLGQGRVGVVVKQNHGSGEGFDRFSICSLTSPLCRSSAYPRSTAYLSAWNSFLRVHRVKTKLKALSMGAHTAWKKRKRPIDRGPRPPVTLRVR